HDEAPAASPSRVLHLHRRLHPRVDAAHEFYGAHRCERILRIAAARRYELRRRQAQALRRDDWRTRKLIEKWDDSATVLRHLRERVHFAAAVVRDDGPAHLRIEFAGGEVPRAGELRVGELFDEICERQALLPSA